MKRLLIIAAAAVVCQAQAVIVYDNTVTATGSAYNMFGSSSTTTSNEVGDKVTLASTERYVTRITFSSWLAGTAETASTNFNLRFYANDGSGGVPGTLLWDSGLYSLTQSTGANAWYVDVPRVQVPDSFTWTLQYSDRSGSTASMGMLIYNPPAVGSSADDFYKKLLGGSTWGTYYFSGNPVANFYSKIEADAVPEPASMLALGAGVAALIARRRRK